MSHCYRMTIDFFIVHSTIDSTHCIPQNAEQFGALHVHNINEKYETRPVFESSIHEFWATKGPNEPSRVTYIKLKLNLSHHLCHIRAVAAGVDVMPKTTGNSHHINKRPRPLPA